MLRGLTAYMILTRVYPVSAGMTILIQAAAGGLGSVLTRWTKTLGIMAIAQVGSEEKADIARMNGADHVLVGRDLDLPKVVAALTDGTGVHLAINGVGGNTLEQTMACVRPFGLTSSIGQIAGAPSTVPFSALRSNALARPSIMAFIFDQAEYEPAMKAVLQKMEQGIVETPHRRYPLSDVANAYRQLEAGEIVGSAVLIP